MNANRKTAITVGVLFIIGTLAGILSAVLTGPIMSDPNYLTTISTNQTSVILGALAVLIMGFALAMVPVIMFPIFKKYNEVFALGTVVFRGTLEAVAYIAIVICWLLLITVSNEYVKAGTSDVSHFQTLGNLLQRAVTWISPILGMIFSIGALMFYYLFYQSKLIPRWLSRWGLIGAVMYLTESILALFGPSWQILMLPLALQEMVLAIWLIVKGFNSSTVASRS